MTYDFHPEARLEYREAAVFYESRRTGLGTAFTVEVEATINRIVQSPEGWQVIEQDVRAVRLTSSLTEFCTQLSTIAS
jgi:hypothetical protein